MPHCARENIRCFGRQCLCIKAQHAAFNPEVLGEAEKLVRDSNGIVRLFASKVLEVGFSPSLAKSVAIHSGMLLAAESGLLPAIMESDAQSVINLILAGSSIRSEIGLVIDDILDLKSRFDFTCFSFALRSSNRVAHCFAKMALVHALDVVLFEEAPPSLQYLV
ncbi:hypothetical protein ACOSQ4_002856 [Xanthoceras sorbifolium]